MDKSRALARSRASGKPTQAWDVWFAISGIAVTTGFGVWWLEPSFNMEDGAVLVVTTALVAALSYAVFAWVRD